MTNRCNKLDESVIPLGMYCYTWETPPSEQNNYIGKVKQCPYWDMKTFLSGHEYEGEAYGYCDFMQKGDNDLTSGLLFDQIKECGIRELE